MDVIERGFVAKWCKGEVLDVASGTGRFAFLEHYRGLEISDEMIKKAKENYPDKWFIKGDATEMTFPDNSFDTVIAFRLFMHLGKDKWRQAYDEMYRVCKKGGRIIFDIKTPMLTIQNMVRKGKIYFVPMKDLPKPKVIFNFPPKLPLTKLVVIEK
jgi:ubiquinone/menaquinone biosynthesis C-methylase UbiE